MSYPLTIYKNEEDFAKNKKLIEHLERLLLIKLENWKEYKPTRGIIEDFFKAAKGAFELGKFHSYTDKSMYKNIYLCLLLTAIVVQCGFKTKTQLQHWQKEKLILHLQKIKKPKPIKKKKKPNKNLKPHAKLGNKHSNLTKRKS